MCASGFRLVPGRSLCDDGARSRHSALTEEVQAIQQAKGQPAPQAGKLIGALSRAAFRNEGAVAVGVARDRVVTFAGTVVCDGYTVGRFTSVMDRGRIVEIAEADDDEGGEGAEQEAERREPRE